MRLDELKNELPETPEFIHTMIQNEVEKQLQKKDVIPIGRKKKGWNIGRMAAAVAVGVLAASTVAYAGTRLYRMYLEKQEKYSVSTRIEAEEEGGKLPSKIHGVEIKAGYIPDGMEWIDLNKLCYSDTPHQGGITIASVLMDQKDLGEALTDTNVVESEERNFGSYEGVYLRYGNLENDQSFHQRIYMLCPEKYRVFTLYIGDDVSKEDAVKFAGNLTVTDSDELIDTKGMDTWSDFAKDKTGGASAAGGTVSAAELPVHQAGDVFAIRTVGEDKDGNAVASDKIKAKVENVEISDDLGLLKEIPDEWKEAVGSDGKLKENHLSYIKSGDGVKELSKTVREEDVKQKLVHVTVTYTNDAEEEINHMLYMGTLTLMKQKDGEYQVYDPEEESGKDYDRVIGDGVARAGEMTYFSEKEEYGNGGNYVASLEPGESITLEMAWIVNEKNLKDMYLNLNGSGSAYGIEAPDMETGVVFIGKQ